MIVEFQIRGSQHIRSFQWILNGFLLSRYIIQEYITFVDGIIKAIVPDVNKNEELFRLVTIYEHH